MGVDQAAGSRDSLPKPVTTARAPQASLAEAAEGDAAAEEDEAAAPGGNKAVTASSARALSSSYRGVCYNRKNRRWQAAINSSGKYLYLGSYGTEREAAEMFDRAAVRIRGLKARLNFEPSDYINEETGEPREDPSIESMLLDACDPSKPKRRPPAMGRGAREDGVGASTLQPGAPMIPSEAAAHKISLEAMRRLCLGSDKLQARQAMRMHPALLAELRDNGLVPASVGHEAGAGAAPPAAAAERGGGGSNGEGRCRDSGAPAGTPKVVQPRLLHLNSVHGGGAGGSGGDPDFIGLGCKPVGSKSGATAGPRPTRKAKRVSKHRYDDDETDTDEGGDGDSGGGGPDATPPRAQQHPPAVAATVNTRCQFGTVGLMSPGEALQAAISALTHPGGGDSALSAITALIPAGLLVSGESVPPSHARPSAMQHAGDSAVLRPFSSNSASLHGDGAAKHEQELRGTAKERPSPMPVSDSRDPPPAGPTSRRRPSPSPPNDTAATMTAAAGSAAISLMLNLPGSTAVDVHARPAGAVAHSDGPVPPGNHHQQRPQQQQRLQQASEERQANTARHRSPSHDRSSADNKPNSSAGGGVPAAPPTGAPSANHVDKPSQHYPGYGAGNVSLNGELRSGFPHQNNCFANLQAQAFEVLAQDNEQQQRRRAALLGEVTAGVAPLVLHDLSSDVSRELLSRLKQVTAERERHAQAEDEARKQALVAAVALGQEQREREEAANAAATGGAVAALLWRRPPPPPMHQQQQPSAKHPPSQQQQQRQQYQMDDHNSTAEEADAAHALLSVAKPTRLPSGSVAAVEGGGSKERRQAPPPTRLPPAAPFGNIPRGKRSALSGPRTDPLHHTDYNPTMDEPDDRDAPSLPPRLHHSDHDWAGSKVNPMARPPLPHRPPFPTTAVHAASALTDDHDAVAAGITSASAVAVARLGAAINRSHGSGGSGTGYFAGTGDQSLRQQLASFAQQSLHLQQHPQLQAHVALQLTPQQLAQQQPQHQQQQQQQGGAGTQRLVPASMHLDSMESQAALLALSQEMQAQIAQLQMQIEQMDADKAMLSEQLAATKRLVEIANQQQAETLQSARLSSANMPDLIDEVRASLPSGATLEWVRPRLGVAGVLGVIYTTAGGPDNRLSIGIWRREGGFSQMCTSDSLAEAITSCNNILALTAQVNTAPSARERERDVRRERPPPLQQQRSNVEREPQQREVQQQEPQQREPQQRERVVSNPQLQLHLLQASQPPQHPPSLPTQQRTSLHLQQQQQQSAAANQGQQGLAQHNQQQQELLRGGSGMGSGSGAGSALLLRPHMQQQHAPQALQQQHAPQSLQQQFQQAQQQLHKHKQEAMDQDTRLSQQLQAQLLAVQQQQHDQYEDQLTQANLRQQTVLHPQTDTWKGTAHAAAPSMAAHPFEMLASQHDFSSVGRTFASSRPDPSHHPSQPLPNSNQQQQQRHPGVPPRNQSLGHPHQPQGWGGGGPVGRPAAPGSARGEGGGGGLAGGARSAAFPGSGGGPGDRMDVEDHSEEDQGLARNRDPAGRRDGRRGIAADGPDALGGVERRGQRRSRGDDDDGGGGGGPHDAPRRMDIGGGREREKSGGGGGDSFSPGAGTAPGGHGGATAAPRGHMQRNVLDLDNSGPLRSQRGERPPPIVIHPPSRTGLKAHQLEQAGIAQPVVMAAHRLTRERLDPFGAFHESIAAVAGSRAAGATHKPHPQHTQQKALDMADVARMGFLFPDPADARPDKSSTNESKDASNDLAKGDGGGNDNNNGRGGGEMAPPARAEGSGRRKRPRMNTSLHDLLPPPSSLAPPASRTVVARPRPAADSAAAATLQLSSELLSGSQLPSPGEQSRPPGAFAASPPGAAHQSAAQQRQLQMHNRVEEEDPTEPDRREEGSRNPHRLQDGAEGSNWASSEDAATGAGIGPSGFHGFPEQLLRLQVGEAMAMVNRHNETASSAVRDVDDPPQRRSSSQAERQ